mgnify:CR=1 FL=1
MSIDINTVKKVSKLARIKTTDAEAAVLAEELTRIMKMVEQLNEVKTDGVEPMTSVIDMQALAREDAVTDGGMADKILANAPEQAAGFFVVPKVME